MCGQCHIRTSTDLILQGQSLEELEANPDLLAVMTDIDAKGGMIQHHEQFEEWYNSPHKEGGCQTCHDPHSGEIEKECGDCHTAQANIFKESIMARLGVTCENCHMAKAVKSAEGNAKLYFGDVPSHLFRINTSATATLLDSSGKKANGYLTLGWSCAAPNCHGAVTMPRDILIEGRIATRWDTAKAAAVVEKIQTNVSAKLEEAKVAIARAERVFRPKV